MLPLSFVGAPLEMTKRRWKESMQVLFEKHFGPTKEEELKESKRGNTVTVNYNMAYVGIS